MDVKDIQFEAERIDNGKIISGYLYKHEPPLRCISSSECEQPKYYIINTGYADWNMNRPVDFIEVKPDTIKCSIIDILNEKLENIRKYINGGTN